MKKGKETSQKTYLLYARVSPKGSTWAADETSISTQLAEMRTRVQQMSPGARMIEVFDEFRSGKDLKRPGMRRILDDLDERPCPWQCLVVWALDRLSRSLADALPIFSRLRDAGCDFLSVTQDYLSYTGAMGRYMLQQTIAIAELERGMTSERVTAKIRHMASQGKCPYSLLPMGYYRSPEDKHKILVDQEKAEIVRSVFDLFCAGRLSWSEISARHPGTFKNRQHLYKLLRTPMYMGEIRLWGDAYKCDVEPIISREQYERAQALLADGQTNKSKVSRRKFDYLLAGLVSCSCGRKMTTYTVSRGGKSWHYYKCTSPDCKLAVCAEDLEAAVLERLVASYTDESKIREAVSAYLDETARADRERAEKRDAAGRALQAARERVENATNMFLMGKVDDGNKGYFNALLYDARQEVARLEAELAAMEPPGGKMPPLEDMMPALIRAGAEWARKIADGDAPYSVRRNLVLSAVQDIVCQGRRDGVTEFKLDFAVMRTSQQWWANGDLHITCIVALAGGYRARIASRAAEGQSGRAIGRGHLTGLQ